ncbi:MAG: dTDP-4-dehydrorhamnose 3,5-epimerase, partial [bacterium]
YFCENYHQKEFEKNGIKEKFVQDNMSFSKKGTLRGMHYQINPHAQAKIVYVFQGTIFDAVVDIRNGSPTFGSWFSYVLKAKSSEALFVPRGFAHGFCVLSKTALVSYKCSSFYKPEFERSIKWNDKRIRIKWPIKPDLKLMSEKDKSAPSLDNADINFSF